jgi:hypothetical protein
MERPFAPDAKHACPTIRSRRPFPHRSPMLPLPRDRRRSTSRSPDVSTDHAPSTRSLWLNRLLGLHLRKAKGLLPTPVASLSPIESTMTTWSSIAAAPTHYGSVARGRVFESSATFALGGRLQGNSRNPLPGMTRGITLKSLPTIG